ncbi:MAG: metallophosphoesterase [Gammaproteobacteria bacterium]
MRLCKWLLVSLTLVAVCGAAFAHASPYRFEGAERVVAFGDVHGAYDELVALLRGVGVLDSDGRWQGGRTHLVSTGDLIHRGDNDRQVLELLMRLEREAAAAGGAVHVLLGNHEVMTLSGDLRYVSEGSYASFGGRDARRAAFAPDGDFGSWLLQKPFAVVVKDTLFTHGGVSRLLEGLSLDEMNEQARADLVRVVSALHALHAAGESGGDGFGAVRASADPTVQAALRGLPYHPGGMLWYRGSSLCHPYTEGRVAAAVLEQVGARRVAVGHTVTPGRSITSRLDGRVYRMDTGMNTRAYGGRPTALVIDANGVSAYDLERGSVPVDAEPNRVWDRPHGLSDAEIESFLRDGEIVQVEELGEGVTRPLRLTLTHGGRTLRALYKSEDTNPEMGRGRWSRQAENADRFVYDYTAYRLDRIIGLEMVPVSVLRELDGKPGVVTVWLEGAFNENRRQERQLEFDGHCELSPQYDLMNVFDILVHNVDRNLGNIMYDADWQVWLIDHSRAFKTARGVPAALARDSIVVTPEMADALALVTPASLQELDPYLHPRQIQALLSRARELRRR